MTCDDHASIHSLPGTRHRCQLAFYDAKYVKFGILKALGGGNLGLAVWHFWQYFFIFGLKILNLAVALEFGMHFALIWLWQYFS